MELNINHSWGKIGDTTAKLFHIIDSNSGFSVDISDYGARLIRVLCDDREGVSSDINFGHFHPELYPTQGRTYGANIGRVANRIGNGKFLLENTEHQLFINNAGKHTLHGGNEGFHFKFWHLFSSEVQDDIVRLTFQYFSPHGEESFPGNMTVFLTYEIRPNELLWKFTATTDRPTLVNLTNHAYWNLESINKTIDNHLLTLASTSYMPADETGLPTGEILDTLDTDLDFTHPRKLSSIFSSHGDIDNYFFLDNSLSQKQSEELDNICVLYSPESGREMSVFTTEPGLQVYTGNAMNNYTVFGRTCQKHAAICLETHDVPNAINFPLFEQNTVLYPNETYVHITKHKFKVKS